MRQKAAPLFERIASAIARHKTAQAALDAFPGPEDYPKYLSSQRRRRAYP
jgi:hypothetical protein